ncbi:MAG: peroxiredoxin family protein [Armatimonadota bacterium]|nr:peroxiredoxin family protein [Armatimonadota bacterium]
MSRPVPIKLIFMITVFALVLVAAGNALRQSGPIGKTTPGSDLSADDQAWLKDRLARPAPALPKTEQPQVLLLWREPTDAAKVRPIVSLVDHPEGLNGVYGMDVTSSDKLALPLRFNELMEGQPISGAWLVALDGIGHVIGSTPVMTKPMVDLAFQMAQGKPVQFPGSEDPYLGKVAPDFSTTTQSGKPFNLSAMKGHKLVVTFYCGCDRCREMSNNLAVAQKTPALKGIPFFSVTHMLPARSKEFFGQTGELSTPLNEVAAAGKGIAARYDSKTCPRVWYIGADGRVQYYSRLGENPNIVISDLVNAASGKKNRVAA